ncbi:MAG TPA: glycosyltransferase family 39 protein [Candidatus Limnocylindrales bacterium]|nr:glycosyltransferase family 39 protein [Candidatus Limnocylindrales bacterium]
MSTIAGRLTARLGVGGRELACVAGIVAAAAAFRFVNLPVRGGWDSDQGTEMLALRDAIATGRLPTFGPVSSLGNFHHGALSRDLILPAAWLGNGDPTWVVGENALLGLLVVLAVWWIARSIAGTPAGLAAALLAAVSASLIGYSTFIWNPTPVEPGAALAYLGAWQAVRTQKAQWWILAAIGSAVAAQSHIAAAVILLPMAAAYALDLRRGPAVRRRSIVRWGLASAVLFFATFLPMIVSEIGHDFSDTRGILAYFTSPTSTAVHDPITQVLFSAVRILAWPLTRWPLIDFVPAFPIALVVAAGLAVGLLWRLGATAEQKTAGGAVATAGPDHEVARGGSGAAGSAISEDRTGAPEAIERLGTRLVGGGLLLIILALGLGVHAVSEVQGLPTEQYHIVADPLVFVAAGLVLGGLWRSLPLRDVTAARRAAAVVAIVALVAWNVDRWPPLTSPDGGWPAAQAAATRVERDAGSSAVALVPLFAPKGGDAYAYPLARDGVTLVAPEHAAIVVILCDTFWLSGCGGPAEEAWRTGNPAGRNLVFVDRFAAAPDRLLTVYRRAP